MQCSDLHFVKLYIIVTVCWQSWNGISGGKLVLTMADVKFRARKFHTERASPSTSCAKGNVLHQMPLAFLMNSWKLPGDYTKSGHCLR
jgi:hypothetical protein